MGGSQSLVPTRNASSYDLSAKDPARHPRWDNNLYIVNKDGKKTESWDQHNKLFVRTHKVLINPYDPEKHVWLVDDGAHAVYKFTNDGKKLVMQLGEFKVPGNDDKHFARPTDIAWLPDGTFFVSDGYTNTRVVKFDKDGKFLMTWGEKGERGEGDASELHEHRALDGRGCEASRLRRRPRQLAHPGVRRERQVPRHVAERAPPVLHLHGAGSAPLGRRRDHAEVHQVRPHRQAALGCAGARSARFPGGFWGVHQFSVDSEGNLYTADVHIGRPQKFKPKAGANKAHLVGQPFKSTS